MKLELDTINGETKDVGVRYTYGKVYTAGRQAYQLLDNAMVEATIEGVGVRTFSITELPSHLFELVAEAIFDAADARGEYED